ncbi:hypothetical protein L9F63_002556, partial [Diploptera punctata]
ENNSVKRGREIFREDVREKKRDAFIELDTIVPNHNQPHTSIRELTEDQLLLYNITLTCERMQRPKINKIYIEINVRKKCKNNCKWENI